ncbi:MAG: glycosyltransferase family 2 protein [Candidatus Gottesmanbacteria bacterium]|nr:glycosyltransferase family 2 protein [Candidatus Gottesmanbacteria bacterium]
METISVVLSVYNEEAKLGRTLAALHWADEIIVIDNESSDRTVSIATSYGAKVYKAKNNLMLNINKNMGFVKAKSDWILNLDGDEVIPAELAQEIKHRVLNSNFSASNKQIDGFWIARKNILFGKWIQYGLWWPDRQLRLFRRGNGKFPCMHIHEYIEVSGSTGQLVEPYIHYNYESVHQYLMKIDRASTSEALYLKELHNQINWHDVIRYPLSDFLKIYFLQYGYKAGFHGLMLSVFQAFYTFCTYAKLWEMGKFIEREVSMNHVEEEISRAQREVRYWLLSVKISQTTNVMKKLWYRMVRKYATYR